MKTLALSAACLFIFACSSGGTGGGSGGRGGHAGTEGGGGGISGAGGTTGSGGQSAGSGGQSAGSGGQSAGSGGQSAGSGGQSAGSGGQSGGSGGQSGSGGKAGGSGGSGAAGNGGNGGTAGRGGGGQAGGAGAGGAGGGQSCSELQTAYGKAVAQAKACHTNVTEPQCTQLVTSPLLCCPIYVQDRTELDRIYAQFQAAGCTPAIGCPAVLCHAPSGSTCVPIDSGDWCRDAVTP